MVVLLSAAVLFGDARVKAQMIIEITETVL